jgi:hypothetical protein
VTESDMNHCVPKSDTSMGATLLVLRVIGENEATAASWSAAKGDCEGTILHSLITTNVL